MADKLQSVKLRLDSEKPLFECKNFWNNIHFHPTDAIEDAWGQRILDQIAEDHVAKTVRMYTMFEDIVTQSDDGTLQYDFTLNDLRIDYLLNRGFNLMLIYAYVPPFLSQDPTEVSSVCKNKTRYKGKVIITSPPTSYHIWKTICEVYTRHIVERYGESTVAKWYLQCHNEPDLDLFWMQKEQDIVRRCHEYEKLYAGFEEGIRAVSTKLKIGGPVLAENLVFLEHFLTHTKQAGRQLDFISFHAYGTKVEKLNDGSRPFAFDNSLAYICSVKEIAVRCGYEKTPLVIDEWGASNAGFYNVEECPALILREKPEFAAYFAKMLTLYVEKRLPIEILMICLSGQHEMIRDFSGFRNFFTLHFYRKPIYNAFCLASLLGDHYLACRGNGNPNLSVLPTQSTGTVSLMLAYASEHFDICLPEQEIFIDDKHMRQDRIVEYFCIDETHANAIYAYERLGCPDTPTAEQINEISAFSELKKQELVWKADEPLHITMKNASVVLVRWRR